MNKTLSTYLDFVRLSAAVVVVLSHFAYSRLSGGEYLYIRDLKLGSDAVILFFVISGYVIAYVTEKLDRTGTDYALSRLSRLYSVTFPALILTILLDQLGRVADPTLYDGWWYRDSQPVRRFFANLFFVNELWFDSIRPFSNGPYWSLCYEFWYYALFGAAYYIVGWLRIALITLIVLISGPKIMILFPIWLLGVWTFRFNKKVTVLPAMGWVFVLLPIIVYAWIKSTGIYVDVREFTMEILGEDFVRRKLKFSDEFLISYLYGMLVAMNFVGIKAVSPIIERHIAVVARPIQYCAGLTFSLYLLHYPLLHFFAAVYGGDVHDRGIQALILLSTLAAVVVIGGLTERKKHVARRVFVGLPRLVGRAFS